MSSVVAEISLRGHGEKTACPRKIFCVTTQK